MPLGSRPRPTTRLLAAGITAVVFLTGCTSLDRGADNEGAAAVTDTPRAQGGEAVFGAEQEPSGFNYTSSKDSIVAVRDVIENIHYFASKSKPDGTLDYVGLESEPEVISSDPQVIEWKIAKDATWSDGKPVTTADIAYHFANVMDPKHEIASRVGYEQIKTLDDIDEKTFRATFDSPYGDFRGLWQAVPQAEWVKAQPAGWAKAMDSEPGPSAGPYVFEQWSKGESITLVPNKFWKGEPSPTLDRLVLRFLPETSTLPDALRNGEVDVVLAQAQTDLKQELEGLPGLATEVVLGPSFEHLVLNVKDPVVGDLAVRQAIAHAVDRQAIVKALVAPFAAEATPLHNMVLTNAQTRGHESHGDEYQQRDVQAAGEVLDAAGWLEAPDGIRAKNGKPLEVEFATTAGNERREQGLELIKNQLKDVGIDVRISTCPEACLFSDRLPSGQFQVALKSFSGSPFPLADASARFTTGGGDNYSKYSDSAFDDLASQARGTLDVADQTGLANEMDKVLWEDLPMIPLFQRPDLSAYRTTLVGVEPNGTRDGMLWNAAAWGRSE